MKFCGKCGAKLNESQRFCAICGANVPASNNKAENDQHSTAKIDTTQHVNKQSVAEVNTTNIEKQQAEKVNSAPNQQINNIKVANNSHSTKKTSAKFNMLLLIPIISVIVLAGAVFGMKFYFTNKYSPENTVASFENAIISKDTEALKKLLYTNNENLEINDDSVNPLINCFNEDSEGLLEDVISSLNKDVYLASMLSSKGSDELLKNDKLFALTIANKNILFTKYAVIARPIYATVNSNYIEAQAYAGEKDLGAIERFSDETQVGPLLPGNVELTLKTKNVFGEEISESQTLYLSDMLYDDTAYFFNDYILADITSNLPEANIVVNGKDTGITVKDCDGAFGPVLYDDVIKLSYNLNGKEYTTKERKASNTFLTLDFSYADYSVISKAIGSDSSNATFSDINDTVLEYLEKYKDRDFIIEDSTTRVLDFKAMNPYTADELYIARNEMLARHGYVFSSYPNLQSYFENKPWYKADPSFSGVLTNEIEKNNYDLIRSLEFLKAAYEKYPTITVDYLFENSDSKELTSSQVSRLNDWELVVGRNEIFARYGLEFSTKELMEHFKSKSWFGINSAVGNNVPLKDVESKNVQTFVAEEQKRMNTSLDHDLGE